jgi:hypothetical protein
LLELIYKLQRQPRGWLRCLGLAGLDLPDLGPLQMKTVLAISIIFPWTPPVNLAAETIDVVINPQQKRRLFRREGSAVRINGPLIRPSVRVLPLSEAVELYGTLLMPYIFLPERALGQLWYLIRRDIKASPCLR